MGNEFPIQVTTRWGMNSPTSCTNMEVVECGVLSGVSSTESPDVIDTHGSIFMTNRGRGIVVMIGFFQVIWLLMDFTLPHQALSRWMKNEQCCTPHSGLQIQEVWRKHICTHEHHRGTGMEPRKDAMRTCFGKSRFNHIKRILIKRRNKNFLLPILRKEKYFSFSITLTDMLLYRTKDPYFH